MSSGTAGSSSPDFIISSPLSLSLLVLPYFVLEPVSKVEFLVIQGLQINTQQLRTELQFLSNPIKILKLESDHMLITEPTTISKRQEDAVGSILSHVFASPTVFGWGVGGRCPPPPKLHNECREGRFSEENPCVGWKKRNKGRGRQNNRCPLCLLFVP